LIYVLALSLGNYKNIISKYTQHTDKELVKACLKHKKLAQEELYNRFSYMVKGVCLRYSKDEEEGEDFLQDTFITVFEKLKQYKGSGALGGWIRRIAVNTALTQLRKQKLHTKSLSMEIEQLIPDEAANQLFEQIDLDILVRKIQSLPSGYRTVFNLYAIEGFSHKEISENLSISIGTSKSQFSRARKLLIQMIQQDAIKHSNKLKYVE